jgi:hypothetical protein
MTHLPFLIRHIADLSGAEFKLAAYLYLRLERRREFETTVEQLAQATGLSWRQTQSALRSLDRKAVIRIDSRRNRGTRCSLPSELIRSRSNSPAWGADRQKTARSRSRLKGQAKASETNAPAITVSRPSETSVPTTVVRADSPHPSPSRPDLKRKIEDLLRTLLNMRGEIPSTDLQRLLQRGGDGDAGRLLRRLQEAARQRPGFDTFVELCIAVGRMVHIR